MNTQPMALVHAVSRIGPLKAGALWIRSLRSKTGCIKRGGRLRRPPTIRLHLLVHHRRSLCDRAVHGGAGVAPASLYLQPFGL